MHETPGEYKAAKAAYKKALTLHLVTTSQNHKRSYVKADIAGHYAYCLFKYGKKTGLQKAIKALRDLEKNTVTTRYEHNVWVNWGCTQIANIYNELNNKEKSQQYMKKTKKIIDENPNLILRKNNGKN